ncbi:MAG TPA: DUF2127 domain-containing protein [Terracidiphilus sp.]|jgi:uncharacterized membrane protein (DUF2068 family)|nr:DUF2127 domain-containing protein [Terracidiphilus sp.]
MIGTVAPMAQQKKQHNKVLILIAIYKGLQAALFFAVGIGALRLLHKDVGDVFEDLRDSLHFSPESRLVNFLLEKASLIDDPILRRIGAVAFSYAALSLAEGTGLYLEKAWGELLTLVITASFLPWEVFEVIRHVTWVRIALLVINTLVFIYLLKVVALRRKPSDVEKSAASSSQAV